MRVAILLAVAAASASGAAVFKGKLVRNEIGGAPVAGARLNAPGANPTDSRSPFGDFVLQFRYKNPGDRLTLSVAMAGMVVVNWVQLEVTLPADPDSSELTLILAREADREEMARRFFRLRSLEAIEASYRREIEEGKKDRTQLQKERDEAKAAAASAAEELAKLRPGQASALYEDAMRYFALGKTDDALRTLDEAKLRRFSQEAQKRKEQAEKQLAEATRSWLLRGKLLTTKFRFTEAQAAYEEAVKASPGDFDACFERAGFLASLKRYTPATEGHKRCLAIARAQADAEEVARTLNNLGFLHHEQKQMEEARKDYEEALATFRELARANPDTYLPDVAVALNNLGNLHSTQNRMEEARKDYEEALGIRRQLARANPDTYRPDVAQTLGNIGNLDKDQNRMEEALATFRELARANPNTYLPDVAAALNNLGFLHHEQKQMEEARKDYEEALGIRRQLARANPDTYLPAVARTLSNIGNLKRERNQMDEARKDYEEALATFRQLASANPDTYLPYVAIMLNTLGLLHSDQNRMEEARKAYDEALGTYRQLARANPDTYLPYVARVLRNIGAMYAATNQKGDARRAFEEALEIFRDFAMRDPAQYQRLVDAVTADLAKVPR